MNAQVSINIGPTDGRRSSHTNIGWMDRRPSSGRVDGFQSTGRWSALVLVTFMTVIGVRAGGLIAAGAYPVVVVGGVACGVIGLYWHQPQPRWPWKAIIATGLLWAIAGMVREASGATGDLTRTRSLWPDAFALPGYGLFLAAVYALVRSRRSARQPGTTLDGLMLGLGAMLIVNELVITPTFDRPGAWPPAQAAVAIYPALSMCTLVFAAQLAFGAQTRSPAFRYLLAGTTSLVVGDIVFALGEIGTITVSQRVLEVPYLLVPAFYSAALLHPSVRSIAKPQRRHRPLGTGRLIAVAGALLAPIVVIATAGLSASFVVAVGLCLALAGLAIVRLGAAMREQAESEAKIIFQATHDELTGLPSRLLISEDIDDRLTQTRHAAPLAVMFIDLDDFKLVNDSMGHPVGDELLVVAAQRITTTLADRGLVGRISGDEFIVVAHDCDHHSAHALADRIRDRLGQPYQLSTGEVFISASIGVTVATENGYGLTPTLIQQADTAMYQSKDAGRNTVTMFDASMRERVERRMALEQQLRHGLTTGQFAAHYQPIVALPDGEVLGFEALARWPINSHQVSTDEFIRVAEQSGLIVPLGAFILDQACHQLAQLRATIPGGDRLSMSVNISPRQIREGDAVDMVAEALQRHRVPGDSLWLEITESVMMEDSVTTAAVLAGLRTLGVRLSVDDFGTGYSSLSYLKQFPVSRVKIDQSFISGVSRDHSDTSLVAAILGLAAALQLETVAEGVETPEQADQLYNLGCRQAQGHLYQHAVPGDHLPAIINRLGLLRHD